MGINSPSHQITSKTKILSPNQVNFAPGANILSGGNHFVAEDVMKGSPDAHFKKGSAPLRPKNSDAGLCYSIYDHSQKNQNRNN
jgi:hypothetical protein